MNKTDAQTVLDILDGGGWELHRIPPWDALTDEANREQAWGVKRTERPYCDRQGDRQWSAPTALEAFAKAFKALGMTMPVQPEVTLAGAQQRVLAFATAYAKRRGLDPEQVYSLGTADEPLVLRLSDLLTLSTTTAPAVSPCRVCAATEPRTGTCSGPRDPRALCAMAPVAGCQCEACLPQGSPFDETRVNIRMIVCATCGNKRCPHATDHRNACTGSNEVGQKGSSWEHVMPAGSTKETP